MTDYVLKISSFGGIVPGARHYRGRVEAQYPRSCQGGTVHSGGTTRCAEGHEIPDRIQWDVEAFWDEPRYERWAARQFEGDGPAQFAAEADLTDAAVRRFLYERESGWWEEKYPPPQPGYRLYLRWLPSEALPDDDDYPGAVTSKDIRLLAEVPEPEADPAPERDAEAS